LIQDFISILENFGFKVEWPKGIENQMRTLPAEEEVEENRQSIWHELKKVHAERLWRQGAAFHHLPFPEKKKLINLTTIDRT
jgi:hypothetical protein